MKRRALLATSGIAITSALSGCMGAVTDDSDQSSDDSGEARSDSTDDGDNEPEYDFHNEYIKNGKLLFGHIFNVIDLVEITPEQFTVEVYLTRNPIDSYHVHALEINRIPDKPGNWSASPIATRFPEFNTEQEELEFITRTEEDQIEGNPPSGWVPQRIGLTYDQKGERVSTVEIPVEHEGVGDGLRHEDSYYASGHPFSYLITFELEEEPPMFEPFSYQFTWEDENSHSDNDGEVVGHTPQILRVGQNDFLYPNWTQGRDPESRLQEPDWYRHDRYEPSEHYVDKMEETTNGYRVHIGRVSNYGAYSDKYEQYADKFREQDADVIPGGFGGAPDFVNEPLQHLWGISLEITDESYSKAEELSHPGDGNQAVWEMVNNEEILNDSIIDEIAHKLADVCNMIGATSPTEKVRVIADFVQYLDHIFKYDVTPFMFEDAPRLAEGTAHPTKTLHRRYGDCKDYTVLANALLTHEKFDFTTTLAFFEDVNTFRSGPEMGHVSVGIAFDELEIDSVVNDYYDWNEFTDSIFESSSFIGPLGKKYAYLETSAPFPLGVISQLGADTTYEIPPKNVAQSIDNWMDYTEFEYVSEDDLDGNSEVILANGYSESVEIGLTIASDRSLVSEIDRELLAFESQTIEIEHPLSEVYLVVYVDGDFGSRYILDNEDDEIEFIINDSKNVDVYVNGAQVN